MGGMAETRRVLSVVAAAVLALASGQAAPAEQADPAPTASVTEAAAAPARLGEAEYAQRDEESLAQDGEMHGHLPDTPVLEAALAWIIGPGAVAAAVASLLLIGAILTYNRLARGQLRVSEAWSGIAVQLQRRGDLIPNLIESVKAYAAHEREIFQTVTEARASLSRAAAVGPAEAVPANTRLTHALGQLCAVAENYPDLRASDNFRSVQQELSAVEEKIAYARQFYNRNVLAYNATISTFPHMLMARIAHFDSAEFFEPAEGSERQMKVRY
jgi:LemA protein